jgi:hypothetical protein
MTPSIQDLLLPGGLRSNLFPTDSRYSGLDTNTQQISGKPVIYLKRRFLPPADQFTLVQYHTVTEGERIDNIAAAYLSDPTLYWQICDANNVMDPRETEQINRKLRITLPAGVPGSSIA